MHLFFNKDDEENLESETFIRFIWYNVQTSRWGGEGRGAPVIMYIMKCCDL